MIYSTTLQKKILPYDGTPETIYTGGYSCMKFRVSANSIPPTSGIQIWAANNNDETDVPPIEMAKAFKEGVEYNIVVQKFKVYTDTTGKKELPITDDTLLFVGYFNR